MSADFNILLNGAVVNSKIVITANSFENKQFVVSHNSGANAAGNLVLMETSSPVYISAVTGNLDSNGQFAFTVGPSFGMRGDITLTISAGSNKKKTLEVQFV